MTGDDPLLQVTGLTKRYANVAVLNQCDLQVRAGEIHALLGANGAGKSTLVKLVAGLIRPSAGTMTLAGSPYAPTSKQAAEAAGVEIVQQELNLIPTLSVAENLLLSRLPTVLGIMIDHRQLMSRARSALERVGLMDVDPRAPLSELGVGQQQLVEIAAALDRDCRLLILDEPTAALSSGESAVLFERLNQLRDDGVGMIYISHRLEEITSLSDRITVLRDGRYVGTWKQDELSADELVRQTTDSVAVSDSHVFESWRTDQPLLEVDRISCGIVQDVSFSVSRGERLGITGLVGSGRTELLRAIFGADIATSGQVITGHDRTPQRFHHPREAVAAGLAMVTEDRKQTGLLLPQSIRVNTTLSALDQFSSYGIIQEQQEDQSVSALCESTAVQRVNNQQPVGTLSGGNQQKVVLAKWLLRDGDVFLLDEPTRGIDVAARGRIWQLIAELAKAGKAVVTVSSDLEELLDNCDRIAVMSGGRLVNTFHRPDWSHERIMQAAFATGVAETEEAV